MLLLIFTTTIFSSKDDDTDPVKDVIKESLNEYKEALGKRSLNEYEEAIRNERSANIQYIEVTGRNGDVTLHTYMPKDSVKILVGKPTRTNLMTIGSNNIEQWEYDFPGEGRYGNTRQLWINFENGKLDLVQEI